MKLLLALLIATVLMTETNTPVIEPDSTDVFFALDAGKLVPLERSRGNMQTHAKGYIVYVTKVSTDFPGGKSPVRFHSGSSVDFVVRSANVSVDPGSLYFLRQLDAKKNKREIVTTTGHATPVGAFLKSDIGRGTLPVEYSRYGDNSFMLHVESLPPGEYAVSRGFGVVAFCFGVD